MELFVVIFRNQNKYTINLIFNINNIFNHVNQPGEIKATGVTRWLMDTFGYMHFFKLSCKPGEIKATGVTRWLMDTF
jgi:hypothetical protein